MSLMNDQCNKVCRIIDDVLANRPTERDSLIVAVRKAFESLEQFGNSEQLPSAQPRKKGKWIEQDDCWDGIYYECSVCKYSFSSMEGTPSDNDYYFCPNCGSYNGGEEE